MRSSRGKRMEILRGKPQSRGWDPTLEDPILGRQVLAMPFNPPTLRPRGAICKQSPATFVKLLFRNLPNISLYIYTHIITTWVLLLKSHTPTVLASGLYKGQGTWSDHSSSAEKCRDQRYSSIHHVQYNIDGKCWTRPQEHRVMYMGRGQAFGRGHVPLTSQVRPDHPQGRVVVS